jgi:hypothetical protein
MSCRTQYVKYVEGDPSYSRPLPSTSTYNLIYVIHDLYSSLGSTY